MLYLGNYLNYQVDGPKVSVKVETKQINNGAGKLGFIHP
jgi:hypothetical protein